MNTYLILTISMATFAAHVLHLRAVVSFHSSGGEFMCKRKVVSLVFCCIVFIVTSLVVSGCGKTTAQESVCKVATIEGTVTIARTDGKSEPAAKGLRLFAGDKVFTEENGSAKLTFRDFASVVLGKNSTYAIVKHESGKDNSVVATSTELLKGVGLVNVDPSKNTKFTIKTPHVITGVLGTQFGLEVVEDSDDDGKNDEGQTTLAVLTGLVSFEGQGTKLEVGPGCGARAQGKNPPGLINKFFEKNTNLSKHLQNFIKQEATGGTDLNTIFRSY